MLLSFLLGLFGVHGWGVSAACTGVGILAFTALQNKAANRNLSPADRQFAAGVLSTKPAPGRARIIVYRSNSFLKEGFMGRTLGIDLTLDGMPLTQLTNPRFTAIDVAAGEHVLGAGAGAKRSDTPVTAVAGETLIFQITLPQGIAGEVLPLVREHETAAVLAKLAAIPMIVPDPRP